MNIKKNNHELSEIKAEFLINYLYPGLNSKWFADNKGTFYRNYNSDILSFDTEKSTVKLSRNGFLSLIPQGLLTKDNDLRGGDFKEKYRKLKDKQQLLHDFFLPIDSFFFRKTLQIEGNISQVLQNRLDYILKQYFGYDYQQETNEYVKAIAPLLVSISRLRADFGFIRDILVQLTGGNVHMKTGRYTQSDRITYSLPYVKYEIIIIGLTNEEFNNLHQKLIPLYEFIREWFIPFDMRCSFEIKHPGRKFILGDRLTLDYNTELTEY